MMTHSPSVENSCDCMPGAGLDPAKMPGHWLLARLGKRVLRPGGLGLTRQMLGALALSPEDHVVEFAPGLGVTAKMALSANPASYTAIERDPAAATQVRRWLGEGSSGQSRQVINGLAQETHLPDACGTAVYGEAMLSMQTETRKRQIIREAFRLLKPGGRYGVHELSLVPDDLPADDAGRICHDVTHAIHHQAVPLTCRKWEELFRSEGFEIAHRSSAPMALLEPMRLIKDEGFWGAARFFGRLLADGQARRRVKEMRRVFHQYRHQLAAICLVLRKPERPQ